MRGKLKLLLARFPRGFLLSAGLTLLMAVGLLAALADLGAVPAAETQRANDAKQRVIVDVATGAVSGLSQDESTSFDVAEEPALPPEEPVESEPTPDAETEAAAIEPAPVPVPEAASPAGLEPLRRDPLRSVWPTVSRSRDSLVSAPAPEITEKLGDLQLPKNGGGIARAATLYARGFKPEPGKPMVAILVTDVGFSPETLQSVLSLPPEISIALSPYAADAQTQVSSLRNAGHETWAMLPAATARYPQDDPGPLGLIPALTKQAMLDRLYRVLAASIGSVGVVLPADEAISSQPELWGVVYEQLHARGLYVLSTHPTRSIDQLSANPAAKEVTRRSDLTIDSTPGAAFIRSKLATVSEVAAAQGKLIVLVNARPQSLALLSEWLKSGELAKHASLAPLSALFAPERPEPVAAPVEEKKSSGH